MPDLDKTDMLKRAISDKTYELSALRVDRATANAVYAAQPAMSGNNDASVEDWLDWHQTNEAAIRAYHLNCEIDNLENTLAAKLASVSTRFLLTDGQLVSPAGFGVEDNVFIKNAVWIETDRLPKHTNLNAFDMSKTDRYKVRA